MSSEILKQNNLQFLILENNDPDLIATKISEISEKPLEWKKKVSMRCKEISSDYTREKQLKKFRNVFNDIVQQY